MMHLDGGPRPHGGWPHWVLTAPYVGSAHPGTAGENAPDLGANCQTYAYAVLALFNRTVPPHRSSELWHDPALTHIGRQDAADLDLALFSPTGAAWGAHVAVVFGDRLLHLSAEVGKPALWSWQDFAKRPRYRVLVGLVRVPAAESPVHG